MQLKVKKIHPNAIIPTRGTPGSAGLDLFVLNDGWVPSGQTVTFGTGIAVAIPPGHVGLIRARSSAIRRGLVIAGTIDSDYRGEIGVLILNSEWDTAKIEAGKSYAQLIVVPFASFEVTETGDLDETERGTGGFGSTGNI
jgi:dUTP pyrophosphatase